MLKPRIRYKLLRIIKLIPIWFLSVPALIIGSVGYDSGNRQTCANRQRMKQHMPDAERYAQLLTNKLHLSTTLHHLPARFKT